MEKAPLSKALLSSGRTKKEYIHTLIEKPSVWCLYAYLVFNLDASVLLKVPDKAHKTVAERSRLKGPPVQRCNPSIRFNDIN